MTMYISLAFLFLLGTVNYVVAQVDMASTKDTQALILWTQVVILASVVVKAGTDWISKRKEHAERKELLKLQHEMKDKIDENTTITKETTRTVRHDVRNEINAASMVQQAAAKELAVTVVSDKMEMQRRMDELKAMFAEMQKSNPTISRPMPVEVVNQPDHPVPVDSATPVFPPKP
jgi:uncharacterized coiled-coil protein SlyX